jgi:hypothetical protein
MMRRLDQLHLTRTHGDHVRQLLNRVAVLELVTEVLVRARDPFPAPVGTLDALHLASADFLREQGVQVSLASYDARMLAAARALALPVFDLG